jgi:hypothetical protein
MKKLVLFLLVFVLSVACVPEAEKPFFIEEVEMVIASVTTAGSFEDYKPSSGSDIFLLVEANALSKPDTAELKDVDFAGAASLEGAAEKKYKPSITQTYYLNAESDDDIEATVTWIFVVPRTAQSFTLILPDEQSIVLDSFLTE